MFDKITIRSKISKDECAFLANLHSLQCFINNNGTEVEYRSSNYSNISGVEVFIRDNKLTLKTSLHKYWQKMCCGTLRNDNMFTISEAKSAFEVLLHENRLKPEMVQITQFEIGLNLSVSMEPLSFIKLSLSIQTTTKKEMFVDANYKKNRQRTTEKYKDIRKYFKIYDKSWQIQDQARIPIMQRTNDKMILRIETCYRRHNIVSTKFFSDNNCNRLLEKFYKDWSNIQFSKKVTGKKGCRRSEIERANDLINYGSEYLLNSDKGDKYNSKSMNTQKRTIREFIRDFDKLKHKFNIVDSSQEIEYKRLLFSTFKLSRE